MRFRLAPRSTILDDLAAMKSNSLGISLDFSDLGGKTAKRMKVQL